MPLEGRRIALFLIVLVSGMATFRARVFCQERGNYWLAGRYDGNRVVIYFDKVQFAGTMPSKPRKIAPPVADLFFNPVELPASYIDGLYRSPSAEHFAIGNRYDLMPGNGTIAMIKLTTLVGYQSDEEVGNDSFIGALATVDPPDALLSTRNYYAVRPHQNPRGGAQTAMKTTVEYRKYASLIDLPIQVHVEAEIARLLDERMKVEATDAQRRLAVGVAPALKVQFFQLADGSLRYYVRAIWKPNREKKLQLPYAMAAWVAPLPVAHILAVEKRTVWDEDLGLPNLLNVVDLGGGRTGVILEIEHDDSWELALADYRDGASSTSMPILHTIGVGE